MQGSLAKYIRDNRNNPDYELQRLLIEVNELLLDRMNSEGLRPSDLAERLGVSRPYITKLLDGNENLTLKTLVKVANALRAKIDVRIVPNHVAHMRDGSYDLLLDYSEASVGSRGLDDGEQSALAA